MPLRVGLRRIELPGPAEEAQLRDAFDDSHVVHLPGLFAPDLLQWILGRLAPDRFVQRVHYDLDPSPIDYVLDDGPLRAAIFMFLNDHRFFEAVRGITGCDAPGCLMPNISRLDPVDAHRDVWHDDVDGNRLLALSVNLGGPYDGGRLQIRDRHTGAVLSERGNPVAGDALLLRLRSGLQHRVTPVTGTRSRLVLVGFFKREPIATARWPDELRR